MITRLTIQHYRSIENADLSLGNINVLVGVNGAGKSNILDAITFIRDGLRDGLDQAITERQAIQSIRQWSPTKPYNMTLSIEVKNTPKLHGSFSFTLGPKGAEYEIRREEGNWYDERTYRARDGRTTTGYRDQTYISDYHFVRDVNGSVLITNKHDGETREEQLEDLDDFFIRSRFSYMFDGLRSQLLDFGIYSIFPNTLRQPEKQSRDVYLKSHGENLASILRKMRRKRRVDEIGEIIGSLKKVLPGLRNITVQSIAGLLTPQFLISDSADARPHYFHVNQMSDGTLRILGLLVALYQTPKPSVIGLEEPELTVHPGILTLLAESIHEVSEDAQIIVTTHSPNLIESFGPEKIIVVELKDGLTTAKPLGKVQLNAVKERLLSLGELMSVEGLHA